MKKYFTLIVLSVAIVSYRIYVLVLFGFKYTDSDQTLMWLGAKYYSKGEFHEPFFYGQDYNLMLESFLSVPFYWLGLPLKIALPIVTTILTLLPFFLLARLAIKKGEDLIAVIIISILALLPIEYDLHTSLSRGFVTGIAVFSLIFLLPVFITSRNWYKSEYILIGLLSALSYLVTPNTILLSLPILFYLFLNNIKSKKFYVYTFIGFFIGILILILFKQFYVWNPSYKIHTLKLEYSIELLAKGLKNIDSFLRMVTPFFWKQGYLSLVFPILFSIYFLIKGQKILRYTSFLLLFIFIGPLCVSKIHDGNDSVFFHVSRMYLAVPIIWGFLLTNIHIKNKKHFGWIIILPLTILVFKSYNLNSSIESNLNKDHVVVVAPNSIIEEGCRDINVYAKVHQIDLIIFLNYGNSQLFDYGCPACENDFPRTVYPIYERRTWRLIEDDNRIYNNVLIFDRGKEFDKQYSVVQKTEEFQKGYLIKSNTLTTKELYRKLNVKTRYF